MRKHVKWHLRVIHDERSEFCWHVELRRRGDRQVHVAMVRTEDEAYAHALGALLHIDAPDPFAGIHKVEPCDACNGLGHSVETGERIFCSACNGTGVVPFDASSEDRPHLAEDDGDDE